MSDEEKETEQHSERAFSNNDYHSVFFAETHHGILHADNNGQILDANEFMTELTGYSRHELLEMSLSDLIEARFKSDRINIKALVYGKSRSIFSQLMIAARRGTHIECRIDAKRIPYSLGKPFCHIVAHIYPTQKETVSDLPSLLWYVVKNRPARNAIIVFALLLILSGNLSLILDFFGRFFK